ncbi:MAG: hypothetical protein WB562_18475 [Candidatus Sulfotelmatobacter sp.]
MVEFIDADAEDEPRYVAVRFLVRGKSRDWVFVTSTILEERVTEVRRFAPNQHSGRGPGGMFLRVMIPTLALVTLSIGLLLPMRSLRETTSTTLEEAWKSGRLKDPVEAIIMAERLRDRALDRTFLSSDLNVPLAVMFGVLLILSLVVVFAVRY